MIKKNAYSLITQAINKYLSMDHASASRLEKLNNKVFCIVVRPSNLVLQFVIHGQAVHLQDDEVLATDVKIIGTPLQLLNLMLEKDNRQQLFMNDVEIEGDALVGQAIVSLFDQLDIDWESLLAQYIGDIPTYHTSRVIKGIKSWSQQLQKSFTRDVSDYLHEELQALPNAIELQDYYDEVDKLRLETDRLLAKWDLLVTKLKRETS